MGLSLEQEFHKAMLDIYKRAESEAGYIATRYIRMVAERGGVEAAKFLINSERPSDGFTTLWKKGKARFNR